MSSPTMEICNHFVGEDTILPLKLASDCMRADIESAPTMWLDVIGTKKMQLISVCLADDHRSPLRNGNTKLIDVLGYCCLVKLCQIGGQSGTRSLRCGWMLLVQKNIINNMFSQLTQHIL